MEASKMHYCYIFPDLTEKYEELKVIDNLNSKEYIVKVRVNDAQFANTSSDYVSLLADLVDLATSVYVSDWILPRKIRETFDVHVVLPLRNPNLFMEPSIYEELTNLLRYYTDDNWDFEFVKRKKKPRGVEEKRKLLWPSESPDVALWSGGLDSLAGLVNRIQNNNRPQFTLFGTGGNDQILGKQNEIIRDVRFKFAAQLNLIQVPLDIKYPSVAPPTNDIFRARGFTFKLLGAVCALLEGQNSLYIYENGFGAFNLPFTPAENGISHTRSVHPIALIKMGKFISKIFNGPFRFQNPFLFSTKGEMCLDLIDYSDLAFETISCDGRFRQTDQPSQCGYCSSCLLRRVSLLVALGKDYTEYVVTNGNLSLALVERGHFEAMNYQVGKLIECFEAQNPWESFLSLYPNMRNFARQIALEQEVSIASIQHRILRLYRTYTEEWMKTCTTIRV
ncbi:MAG: hypothetical protein H6636_02490 [Anaerolineales bacterium]|nr:hypothetical protein [Anaerolineales bacterium]